MGCSTTFLYVANGCRLERVALPSGESPSQASVRKARWIAFDLSCGGAVPYFELYQMMAGKIDKAEEKLAPIAIRALKVGAQAIGALAVGALAIGAVALGAVALGRLAIGGARIKRMEIDELVVKKVRITHSLETPPDREIQLR
jgi:hypothetical protein